MQLAVEEQHGEAVLELKAFAAQGTQVADVNLRLFGCNLHLNGELRQQGNSAEMITPIIALLQHIAGIFTLLPGDVVLTGTPAGVGVLQPGDQLQLGIPGLLEQHTTVLAG